MASASPCASHSSGLPLRRLPTVSTLTDTRAPPDATDFLLTVFHECCAMIWCISAFAYLFSTLGYVTLIMCCTHIPNDFEFNYFARRAHWGIEAVPHSLFLVGFVTMYAGLVAWLLQVCLAQVACFCLLSVACTFLCM